jgi:hypothetical protein
MDEVAVGVFLQIPDDYHRRRTAPPSMSAEHARSLQSVVACLMFLSNHFRALNGTRALHDTIYDTQLPEKTPAKAAKEI